MILSCLITKLWKFQKLKQAKKKMEKKWDSKSDFQIKKVYACSVFIFVFSS